MANLIVDIGNTAVKAAWSEGVTLGRTFRYQGEKVCDFICSLVEKERPAILLISSAYAISAKDESVFSGLCDTLVILDSAHTELIEKMGLPSYLSPDRAASIFAARYLFKGKPCSIFDFGTTLTADFIDGKGEYKGGNISLGCRTRLKALNRYSKSLPLFDNTGKACGIGTSLESSVESGVISGIMFEIGGYVALNPENVIVFSGGDALNFAKRMKNSIFVVCNLVLIGLALIADGYVKSI